MQKFVALPVWLNLYHTFVSLITLCCINNYLSKTIQFKDDSINFYINSFQNCIFNNVLAAFHTYLFTAEYHAESTYANSFKSAHFDYYLF